VPHQVVHEAVTLLSASPASQGRVSSVLKSSLQFSFLAGVSPCRARLVVLFVCFHHGRFLFTPVRLRCTDSRYSSSQRFTACSPSNSTGQNVLPHYVSCHTPVVALRTSRSLAKARAGAVRNRKRGYRCFRRPVLCSTLIHSSC
jgi:hypothetical protein